MGGTVSGYSALLPYVRRVRHQQLFLAGLPGPRDLRPKPAVVLRGVGMGSPGISRKPPPPVAGRPDPDWVQPPLFDHPRTYRYGTIDLRQQPVPDNPWLRWALHLARGHAEARGFPKGVRLDLNRSLVMLLANHADSEMIRFSHFERVMRNNGDSPEHTAHVLNLMGILIDDRQPAFEPWLDGKLRDLPPGIANPTHRWAHELHNGGPRVTARDPVTVRTMIHTLRPILLEWSGSREHLREITREDILAQVTPLRGNRRQATMSALRSLFGWAKKNGVIFRDPTSRISIGTPARPIPQPLSHDQVAPTIEAAKAPHARVAIVLAAVHAARHGEIIGMKLSDLDLGNRRLTIAGHTRPMDELTYRVLIDWLDHRRRRWPNTANPHLLVSKDSALRLGPVTYPWLNSILRGLPARLERLRMDRQLDEALASGADPLHLAAVFGISDTTALRYAQAAHQLLHPDPETGAAAEGHTD